MKWYGALFFTAIYLMFENAGAAGFLQAEKFPGTFSDLSFTSRLEVLADGYDGFEAQFDASGRCIQGCPYNGITITEMENISQQNTAAGNAVVDAVLAGQTVQNIGAVGENPNVIPSSEIFSESQQTTAQVTAPVPVIPTQNGQQNTGLHYPPQAPHNHPAWICKYHSDIVDIDNIIPIQAPLDGNLVVTSDYGPRKPPKTGATSWHKGIDLSATTGTPIYAPANGKVTGLPGDACGLGIKIDHGGGWVTQYCHLDKRAVDVGDVVQSGCQIGTVGNTGVSTGPHLHYAIIYNGQPYDPLYRKNHLGRQYRMDKLSPGRDGGVILPGRI